MLSTTGEDSNITGLIFNVKRKIYKYSVDEWVVLILAISAFISIYAAAAAMLFAVLYLIKEKRLKRVASIVPGIKCLWALCMLGVVVAYLNNNETGTLIAMLLAAFVLIGAFARSVMTRMLFDKIIEASCAASLFSFMVALIQYVICEGDVNRSCSVFINANYYAAVIEIVVLFAVYKLCRAENRKQMSFYAIVIALNAVGLYFTGCRTAVFALCAAMLLMLLLDGRHKTLAILLGFSALLAVLVVNLPGVFPRMDQIGTDMDTRIEIWRRAVKGILSHPLFGEGALAYAGFNFKINGVTIVHTHNIYLEPLLSFGILGAVLILIYLKKNLLPIWKMRNVRQDRGRFALALGLLASVALHGIVDATAFSVQTGLLLLLALAMAGIQENSQPVTVYLPVGCMAYLQKTGQVKTAYASKERAMISKKSA